MPKPVGHFIDYLDYIWRPFWPSVSSTDHRSLSMYSSFSPTIGGGLNSGTPEN